jgi:hypothetical protein
MFHWPWRLQEQQVNRLPQWLLFAQHCLPSDSWNFSLHQSVHLVWRIRGTCSFYVVSHSVLCTLHIVHCALYFVLCTLCFVLCPLYFALCTLRFVLVLCALYIVQCTNSSYLCTPSLLMSIYSRKEEGDQGRILYLFALHSSYYPVRRPCVSVFLHNKVTFIYNNLRQSLQGLAALVASSTESDRE